MPEPIASNTSAVMAERGISVNTPKACSSNTIAIITKRMPVQYKKMRIARLGDRLTNVTPTANRLERNYCSPLCHAR